MARSDLLELRTLPSGDSWSPRLLLFGDMVSAGGRSLAQGTENAASLPFIQRAADGGQIDAVIHVGDTVQHTLAQVGDMAYDMAEHEGRRGDLFMQQVCRLWTTGGQVEPVASLVPYMTCPGNHEWHYNFTNYRYLGTWGTWGD